MKKSAIILLSSIGAVAVIGTSVGATYGVMNNKLKETKETNNNLNNEINDKKEQLEKYKEFVSNAETNYNEWLGQFTEIYNTGFRLICPKARWDCYSVYYPQNDNSFKPDLFFNKNNLGTIQIGEYNDAIFYTKELGILNNFKYSIGLNTNGLLGTIGSYGNDHGIPPDRDPTSGNYIKGTGTPPLFASGQWEWYGIGDYPCWVPNRDLHWYRLKLSLIIPIIIWKEPI